MDYQAYMENKLGHANVMCSPPCFPCLADAGLMIASKYPIVHTAFHRFVHSSNVDALASKGILYARIRLGNGIALHVLNTNLQATDLDVRDEQVLEFAQFQRRCLTGSTQHDLVLVCGNFNIDAINERRDAFRTAESLGYKRLSYLISHERVFLDCFRKVAQVDATDTYQRAHPYSDLHPVTFVRRDEQRCIDYMFLSGADTDAVESRVLSMDKVSSHKCMLVQVRVDIPKAPFNLVRRTPVQPSFFAASLRLLVALPWVGIQFGVWFFWRWRELYKNNI
jgi:hypothetical protein